jgi:hypothetical protein
MDYVEETLEITKYHHQDSGIPSTRLMPVLLNHGSITNERDPSIFHNLSGEFAHKLHYFKVGYISRRDIRKQYVSSHGQWHYKHLIHVSPIGSLLSDKLKGSIFLNIISREFAHKLHFFKVGHLPKRSIINQKM